MVTVGGTGAVTSVAGRTGAVVLAESDITSLATDLASKPTAALVTSVGSPGSDTNVPTEKAVRTAIGSGGSGVTSLNGETGAVSVAAGTGIGVNAAGSNVTVSNAGVTSIGPGGSPLTGAVQLAVSGDLTLSEAGQLLTIGHTAGGGLPSPVVRVWPWKWPDLSYGPVTAGSYATYGFPMVQDLIEGEVGGVQGRNYCSIMAPIVAGVQDPGSYTQVLSWQFELPAEWSAWSADAIGFDLLTTAAGASVAAAVYHNASGVAVFSESNITTGDVWEPQWITAAELAGATWVAGDRLTLVLTAACAGAAAVWLGNVMAGYKQA